MVLKKEEILNFASDDESKLRSDMTGYLHSCPIPDDQLLSNLGLFLESKNLSRILLMDFLYRQIIDVPGVVMEFGTRWGQNAALFAALRGIYDPFNRHRKIIGFDTFSGFPAIHDKDGKSDMMHIGQLAVTEGYEKYLNNILDMHEKLNPLSHIKKFDLRKGDASSEIEQYLKESPETIIALAFFDMDLYEPTRKCIDSIRSRLVKGSILAFDELNDPASPGETRALMESMDFNSIRLKRYPYASRVSYFVVGSD